MMRMPDAMPLHLMLAMMQSGVLPNGWTPWSAPWQSFMPEWLRPKSPIEQLNEKMQSQWQQLGDQWQETAAQLQKNFGHPWAAGNENKREEKASAAFPDFLNPEFLSTLGTEAYNRSTGFMQGLQAYLASDYVRPEPEYDVLWQRGSATLFDLAPDRTDGLAVLCVPSLINRSTILDLYPQASFVQHLKSQGFRPLLLDWGTPGEDELDFTTADYITGYAIPALQALREAHDGPIALVGYCMGGIFTVAMAQLAALFVDALVLLATPWDFSAEDTPRVLLEPASQLMFRQWMATQNPVAPLVIQTIFHLINPWRVQEKYSRYPFLSEAEKTHFLAVEQWVNEGVPMPRRVAEECLIDWPQGNILATHQWKVGRRWIEPASIACPTLAVIPTKDAIVPIGVARPLADAIPRCDVIMPETGHVSMVVGKNARTQLWLPVSKWLGERF